MKRKWIPYRPTSTDSPKEGDDIHKYRYSGYLGECPECGGQLVGRRDPKGAPFAGCENYPPCRHTSSIAEARKRALGVTDEELDEHKRRFKRLQERARHYLRRTGFLGNKAAGISLSSPDGFVNGSC